MNDRNSKLDFVAFDSTDGNRHDHLTGLPPADSHDDFKDPFEPPDDFGLVPEFPREHLLNRLRVILSAPHQSLVARILFGSLIMMTTFFSYRWYMENGLVDIDRADPIRAEFKVDINSAEFGEIVALPGLGIKLAQAIVDHRREFGDFDSLHDLCHVPGIGEKTLESLKPYLVPINPIGSNQ